MRAFFAAYGAWHMRMLRENPYKMNAVTGLLLMVVGDRLAQAIENAVAARRPALLALSGAAAAASAAAAEKKSLHRSTVLSLYSASSSCVWTGWYGALARYLPGRPLLWVALTATLPGPSMNWGFFAFSTAFEHALDSSAAPDGGAIWDAVKHKVEDRWLQTVIVSTQVWAPINYVNFRWTPPEARVLVGSVAALIWSVFLSLQQHADEGEGAAADEGAPASRRGRLPFLWQPDVRWEGGFPRLA